MTYRLKVNQQWKIVLALILCPVFFVLSYLGVMLQFPDLHDWVILTSAFALILVAAACALLIITKWLTVECEIRMDDRGFYFKLLRETPFMHIHDFSCNWENIQNASLDTDSQNSKTFYSIHFRKPDMSLSLTANSNEDGETIADEFWSTLSEYIDRYNDSIQSPEMKIKDIGFYERPWAKAITYGALGFAILILLATIFDPDEPNWWRVVIFICFVLPWITNYFFAKRKREEHP